MPRTTRSNNLDLIRWLNGGHEPTAKKMAHITNANYVSKMATGDMDISDPMAREIERAFSLPERWLDRENENILVMSKEDYELVSLLSGFSQDAKNSLIQFLSSIHVVKEKP